MAAPPSGKERLRREKVRILLRTRNDAYPSPRSAATPYTTSGPGDGKKTKCPACRGKGVVRASSKGQLLGKAQSPAGRKSQTCPSCDGEKTIKVDGYIGRVSSERHTAKASPQVIDSEIQRLQTYRQREAGLDDPNEAYGWEKAREAQNAAGSYRELEKALHWLRQVHPIGWDFILWAHGPLSPTLDDNHVRLEDHLVAALAAKMPRQIKVPKREWETLRENRRSRVKQLAAEASPEEIALEVGLPVAVVLQMLAPLPRQ